MVSNRAKAGDVTITTMHVELHTVKISWRSCSRLIRLLLRTIYWGRQLYLMLSAFSGNPRVEVESNHVIEVTVSTH